MSSYVPIIALTLSAVGWALMFWEKRKNAILKLQLVELEATYTSQATASRRDDVTATAAQLELNHPLPEEEETDELSLQLTALQQEMEEEQVRLLNAEDLHLQALKEELEELRKGMQEDLAVAASLACSSHPTSGRSTPTILHTPARSCNGAGDIDSLYSESRSPLLQTPSPPQHNHQSNHSSHQEQWRLQAHALSRSTSGTTTPLTPHSPLSTTQLSVDGDEAWLASSPPPLANFQMAVAPPLPPLTLPVPFAGRDAALTAAFEEDSLHLDDWENEEEWLVKTARGNKKITNTNIENKENENAAPLIVRPLPKVQVPRLNLSRDSTGTPRGGPLTLSARGGIKNNKASTTAAARTSGQDTARRQSQLTSRLSNSSGVPAASMGTPRTARTSSNTCPSGSMTARRKKVVSAVASSPSGASPSSPAVCGGNGSVHRTDHSSRNSPCLFSKSMSAGAAARRDAPTPRLVPGTANTITPNEKTAAEVKAFPLFSSPFSASVPNSNTEGGANESSVVDARPPTKIPRLQLPLN
ncbi:hypothetical protein Ndes2526B_g04033 [Nannochloris sp. 'desiccata']